METVTVKGPARPIFFSVKNALVIAGNRRVPSVCYQILESERKTIESLAAEGKVVLYTEKVRFISGRAHSASVLRDKAVVVREKVKEKDSEPVIIEKTNKGKKKGTAAEPIIEVVTQSVAEFEEVD